MNSPAPNSCRKKSMAPFCRTPYRRANPFARCYTTRSISEQARIQQSIGTHHRRGVLRGSYRKNRKILEPCSKMKRIAVFYRLETFFGMSERTGKSLQVETLTTT